MDLSLIPEKYRRWIPFLLSIMAGAAGAMLGRIIFPFFPILSAAVGFIWGFLGMLLFISLLVQLQGVFCARGSSFSQP